MRYSGEASKWMQLTDSPSRVVTVANGEKPTTLLPLPCHTEVSTNAISDCFLYTQCADNGNCGR